MIHSYSMLDVNSTSTTLYFEQMLSLYPNLVYRSPLLEGYVSASGAGSDALLQASRSAMVSFVEILSVAQLIEFCTCLNNIIRTNIERSIDRVVIPTLVVYGFLFDAGVFERVQEQSDWWVSYSLEGTNIRSTNTLMFSKAGRSYLPLHKEATTNQPTCTSWKPLSNFTRVLHKCLLCNAKSQASFAVCSCIRIR